MRVTVNLTGWADSLVGNKMKLYFPLQLAMYEIMKDCDWEFKVKTRFVTGYVNNPVDVYVVATRCCVEHFHKGVSQARTIEEYTFSFTVPQYTKALVYKHARQALKMKYYRNRKYEEKGNKEE